MRLTGKEIQHIKELVKRSKKSCPMSRALCNDMFDTIEALQQENEQYDQDRIAMQQLWGEECEECIRLRQENEPLKIANRAMEQSMQYWLCNHSQGRLTQHNIDLKLQVRQLQAQVARMREALEKARVALKSVSYRSGLGSDEDGIREALAAIDKIGGWDNV